MACRQERQLKNAQINTFNARLSLDLQKQNLIQEHRAGLCQCQSGVE